MTSADLMIIARRRAGLTQSELAARLRLPASQISRWERGIVQPSLETLRRVVGACGLAVTVGLATADDSYDEWIDAYLELEPAERIEHAVRRANALAPLAAAIEAARAR